MTTYKVYLQIQDVVLELKKKKYYSDISFKFVKVVTKLLAL